MSKTYGGNDAFPKKIIPPKEKPHYGPFRIGDLPKAGHEKTL